MIFGSIEEGIAVDISLVVIRQIQNEMRILLQKTAIKYSGEEVTSK